MCFKVVKGFQGKKKIIESNTLKHPIKERQKEKNKQSETSERKREVTPFHKTKRRETKVQTTQCHQFTRRELGLNILVVTQ